MRGAFAPVSVMMLEAIRLMVIGLVGVFALLLVFVGMVLAMSRLVERFAPSEPPPMGAAPPREDAPQAGELVAVMAAAITRYRARRNLE